MNLGLYILMAAVVGLVGLVVFLLAVAAAQEDPDTVYVDVEREVEA